MDGESLGEIVVGLGPGSYSGVRQAIALATGLGLARNARLTGLPSTAALETDAPAYHAVGDARRGGYYYTGVADGACFVQPELVDLAGTLARIAAQPGWPILAEAPLPGLSITAEAFPSAARLLTARLDARTLSPLEPIYLRDPAITLLKARPCPRMIARTSRCWAEIDCAALRHNAAVARELAGPDGALLAIVKADGYGHGMEAVAQELAAGGDVRFFGVANVTEAARLQEAVPGFDITLLSPALPDEREEIVARGLLPWISSIEEAAAYARAAEAVRGPGGAPFAVEVKVDTGMGRIGVLEDGLAALLAALETMPALRLAGILTHLPSADEDEAFTTAQLAAFRQLTADVPAARRHAQNSAGLLGFARDGCTVFRPGLMLYGSSPIPAFQARLRPALTLKTRVSLVRDLPAGSRTELRPDLRDADRDADRHACRGLRRWLPAPTLQPRCRGARARPTPPGARPGDHGPNFDRPDWAARGRRRRRGDAARCRWRRGNPCRRAGHEVRHHPLGDLHRIDSTGKAQL